MKAIDCCGSQGLVGIAKDATDEFQQLATECNAAYPPCGCATMATPITDDGRWLKDGEAAVTCVEGICQSQTQVRGCGDSLTCEDGTLCVMIETVLGPTMTEDFSCEPNPCENAPLDCECAAQLCEAEDGVPRVCSTGWYATADIACADTRQ